MGKCEEKQMKFALKILICAILSLSIGIATASPLLIAELTIEPFHKVPEGPKANFEVNTVYANFDVQEYASSITSGGENLALVNYEVVLNITNHSEFPARISSLSLVAAEEITAYPSIVGGLSSSSGGGRSGGGGSGFVEGLWLDDEWLNVTWLPDGQWPMFDDFNDFPNVPKVVPPLPENALEDYGKWIEGVHVWETHDVVKTESGTTIKTTDYIFVNGSWVDVTGRIRVENGEPSVLATSTLLNKRIDFVSENFGSYANIEEFNAQKETEAAEPPKKTQAWLIQGMNKWRNEVWAGEGGFDNYWQPGESRLITFKGTTDVGNSNWGLESLAAGKITLYAEAASYLKDREEMKTSFTNTHAVVSELKEVQVAKTGNSYLYNTVLSANQVFQPDQFGVEVYIKPGS
jgi:hypothetical protein